MAYQTIGLQKGNSDSEGKLAGLHLPELAGKSFLDLGCNMGFFCREARQRGARRTLGVDRIRKSIAEAQRLDSAGEYIAGDWFEVLRNTKEQFDIIIHLSAFHYVTDQWEFLNLVQERLAPGGLFILECGIIASEIPRYHYIRRTAFVKHVTGALLKKLVSPFDVTEVGQSVDQAGDPVPRFVYHCRKRQPTPVWNPRAPTAALSQRRSDTASGYVSGEQATVPMDELVPSLVHCPNPPVAHLLQQFVGAGKNQDGVAAAVVDAGLIGDFSTTLADLVPNCFAHVAIPGQIFADSRIREAVANELIARGFNCQENGQPIARTEKPQSSTIDLLRKRDDVTFQWQAAADKFLRPKPVDEEIRMIVGNKPSTAAAWSFPSAAGRFFECYLRVHQRSKPVKFVFDVLDAAKIGADGKIFEVETPEVTVNEVVEGADRYTRVAFDMPPTKGSTIVRLSIKMASPLHVAASARVFVGSPRVVGKCG